MATKKCSWGRKGLVWLFAGALVACGNPRLYAATGEAPESPEVEKPAAATPGGREEKAAAAPVTLHGPKSRLPYPADAEIWADATGTPLNAPPGVPVGAVKRVSILVFRPRGDVLPWNRFVQIYVADGKLEPNPELKLGLTPLPKVQPAATAPQNLEETNVYETRMGKGILVLGIIRNTRTRHLLAYSVLVNGTLNNAQALVQARSMVTELAENARRIRLSVPRPTNSVAAAPTWRIDGNRLRQLVQSIEKDANLSPRVREIARVVMPQATAIEHSTFRTPRAISDSSFIDFYTQQTARQGWGQPIIRDTTQIGRPALLFQRPYDGAVILVRAQPTTLTAPGMLGRPTTMIHILVMEGKIDVSRLNEK